MPKPALGRLDGFPALVQRREVPALALPAHHREAPRFGSNEPRPDLTCLDGLIPAKVLRTMETGTEHQQEPGIGLVGDVADAE